jgi:hypothetical protein
LLWTGWLLLGRMVRAVPAFELAISQAIFHGSSPYVGRRVALREGPCRGDVLLTIPRQVSPGRHATHGRKPGTSLYEQKRRGSLARHQPSRGVTRICRHSLLLDTLFFAFAWAKSRLLTKLSALSHPTETHPKLHTIVQGSYLTHTEDTQTDKHARIYTSQTREISSAPFFLILSIIRVKSLAPLLTPSRFPFPSPPDTEQEGVRRARKTAQAKDPLLLHSLNNPVTAT